MERREGTLRQEWARFKEFVWRERWYLVIYAVIFVLVYGPWFFNIDPRIDTEVVTNTPGEMCGWENIGRQGYLLTEYVFGLRWFNPMFSSGVGYVVIMAAGVLFGYVFWRASACSRHASALFGLFCFIGPCMAELLYFDMMLFDVAWAYVLVAASAGLAYYGILQKRLLPQLAVVALLVWVFSSYQALVVLYAVTVAFCFIMLYYRWTVRENRQVSLIQCLAIIGQQILLFVAALVIYMAITKMFFFEHEFYFGSQIQWGKVPLQTILNNIATEIGYMVFGGKVFYTGAYGVCLAVVLIVVVCDIVRQRGSLLSWLYGLAVLFVQIAPFLMIIYMGAKPAERTELAYSFVMGCDVLFVFMHVTKRGIKRGAALLAAAVLLFTEAKVTMRMVGTEEVRGRLDTLAISQLYHDIYAVSDGTKPVAFIGRYANVLNNACVYGDIVGQSVLQVNWNMQPFYATTTRRIADFAQMMGYEILPASEEQVAKAQAEAVSMPIWPAQGSIADAGDYLIVKLGEDIFAPSTPEG